MILHGGGLLRLSARRQSALVMIPIFDASSVKGRRLSPTVFGLFRFPTLFMNGRQRHGSQGPAVQFVGFAQRFRCFVDPTRLNQRLSQPFLIGRKVWPGIACDPANAATTSPRPLMIGAPGSNSRA